MDNQISCEDLFLTKNPNQLKLDPSFFFNFDMPFDPTNFKTVSYNVFISTLTNNPGPLKLKLSLDAPKIILSKKDLDEDIKLSIEMRLNKVFLSCIGGKAIFGTEVKRTKLQKIRNGDNFKAGPYVFCFLINNDDILEYQFWLDEDKSENFGSQKKKRVRFDTPNSTEFHLTDEILKTASSKNGQNNDYCTIILQNDKYYFKSNFNITAYFILGSGESRKLQKKQKILIGSRDFEFQIEKIKKI